MDLSALARRLASQLTLIRPLVCVDLEATGLWTDTDRIVQMATATVFPDGRVAAWSSFVHPGQPIPEAVTAVHGITDAMVADAPTFAQLAPLLSGILTGADLTGYNVTRFDRPLLSAEFRRAEWPDPTADARVIDAYLIFARQEPRHLDAALRFYGAGAGVERTPHEANSDVAAALAVLTAQMAQYPDLPRSVAGLHDWLNPPDPDRIDPDGKLRWRDGVATMAFGRHRGKAFADVLAADRAYVEELLDKDFPDPFKAIVRAALAGELPARQEPGDIVNTTS